MPDRPDRFGVSTSAELWRDERRGRDVPVRIYSPHSKQKAPVVVFSHGIGEDRDSYVWLGRALAGAGFMAVHVTHAGMDRATLERGYLHLYRAVKRPENWHHRALDVIFVLDRLGADPRADSDRVAVAGHSAGAFTAFSVAGLKVRSGDTLRDPRVKAIVPMSMPRVGDVIPRDGFDSVTVPVLGLTGTCDASLIYRTLPRHRRIPFEWTRRAGHHLVTIHRVNHDTFSARSSRHHEIISAVTITFLRGILLGDAEAAAWFAPPGRQTVSGSALTIEAK